jgi:hypothetical protein
MPELRHTHRSSSHHISSKESSLSVVTVKSLERKCGRRWWLAVVLGLLALAGIIVTVGITVVLLTSHSSTTTTTSTSESFLSLSQ